MFSIQLLAIDGNDLDSASILEYENWTWYCEKNGQPTLKFDIRTTSDSGSALYDILGDTTTEGIPDVMLRVRNSSSNSGLWMEPRNCRFVIVDDEMNLAKSDVMTITCVGVADDLAGQYQHTSNPDRDGAKHRGYKRIWQLKTPGFIMLQVLREAAAVGDYDGIHANYIPNLDWDFTVDNDSNGNAWPELVSQIAWPPDSSVLDLLKGLASSGYVNWWFEGNLLRMVRSTSGFRTRDGVAGPEVALLFGRDIADAPQTRSRRLQASGAVCITDNNKPIRLANPGVKTQRGYRWVTVQGGGIWGTVDPYYQSRQAVALLAKPALTELTRELNITSDSVYLPFFDYQPGDTILAPIGRRRVAPATIASMTLTGDNNGKVGGNVVFGDAFNPNATADQVASLPGGSSIPTLGGPGAPMISGETGYVETMIVNRLTNDNGEIDAGAGLTIVGKTNDGTQAVIFMSGDGNGGYVQSQTIYNRTYPIAANTVLSAQGVLGRSVSARKYKRNIEAHDFGDAILDLEPKLFHDATEWDDASEEERASLKKYPGLIAEEVEEAGLGEFVQYGEMGEVEGLSYDRLLITLIPIIKQQRDELADLKSRLEALENG